jgi:HlyD family type I secretion membrane fusion protein
LGAFTVFLLWAAFAPLNRGAVAQGQVETAGRRTIVQNLEGGEVAQILVHEGQQVEKGQLLVRLEEAPVRLQVERYEQRLRELTAERAVLQAEQAGLGQPLWPADWRNTTDPQIRALMNIWGSAFNARQNLRASQKAVLGQQIAQLGARGQGLRQQSSSVSEQAALINEELEDYRTLYERGLSPKSRVLSAERAEAQLSGRQGEIQAQMRSDAVNAGELRLKQLQVDQAAREQATARLSEVEAEYLETQDRLSSARMSLSRIDIRAPLAGRVLGRPAVTVGGVVRPGDPVVEIVPEGTLMIRAALNPTDRDRVTPGARATLRFVAFPSGSTPALEGKVTAISPDVISVENQPPRYDVQIEASAEERAKIKQTINPGMPVEVSIDAGSRTPLQYFLEPLGRSYRRSFQE